MVQSEAETNGIGVGENTGPGSVAGSGEVTAETIAGRDAYESGTQVIVNIGDLLADVHKLRGARVDENDFDALVDQIVAIASGLAEVVQQGEMTRQTLCMVEELAGQLIAQVYGENGEGIKTRALLNKEAIQQYIIEYNRRAQEYERRLEDIDEWVTRRFGHQSKAIRETEELADRRLGFQGMVIMLIGIIEVILIIIVLLLVRQIGI